MRPATYKTLAVGGLLVAAVCLLVWQQHRVRVLEARNAEIDAELEARAGVTARLEERVQRVPKPGADQAELERLRAAELDLRQEVARLRGQLGARLRAEAEHDARAQVAAMADRSPPESGALGGMTQIKAFLPAGGEKPAGP
ncbi:MAG TPA: hypothetical protein PKM73_02040 [Verrucomicrobiota bacterium]|nr:hypothetical protein [Verrucomicrobiota bacterium]HNU50332.1 hypothetical protein [Verrucomicrobiota bacterium]